MANIKPNENAADLHNGAGVTNWISQINAGGTVYDIATHHGITFRDGNGGTTTTWNGLSDIEVIIPTIADIVQSPIEFAGTVGADGAVVWNATHTDGPKTGYLVFVTADCTFNDIACEAGDMAIYDGAKWNIVSGENQVQLVGNVENNKVTVAVGAAVDVLTVEGKTLTLAVDMNYILGQLDLKKGKITSVEFENATVDNAYVKLTQESDSTVTIGTDINIQKATNLKDGTVTFKNATGIVKDVNFGTFTPGELPSFTKNSQKELSIAGGALTKGIGTDFVDEVTFGKVKFEDADANDENKIVMLTGIIAGEGKEFFKGIDVTKEGETADFTIAGYIAPEDGVSAKYVKGL